MPISNDPHRFDPGSRLIHSGGRELLVEGSRRHRDRLLVKFQGIESRNDAEALRGALYIEGSDLRELPEDEFWSHDIVGLDVVLVGSDELVGTVEEVVPGRAQDLLAVATPAGRRLVPFVQDIVKSVDVSTARVEIDPPAGLLD